MFPGLRLQANRGNKNTTLLENIYQSDLASLMDSEKPHIRKLEKGKLNATVSTLLKLSNTVFTYKIVQNENQIIA